MLGEKGDGGEVLLYTVIQSPILEEPESSTNMCSKFVPRLPTEQLKRTLTTNRAKET